MKHQLYIFLLLVLFVGGCETMKSEEKSLKLEGIIISEESLNNEDEYAPINSNIFFINSLLKEHIRIEEMSDQALKSYYVDYYLAQINNGGFSQFVYNSGWDEGKIRYIRDGLREMGATQNLKLFNKSAKILDVLGSDSIDKYLDSEYFGTNEERDILNAFNSQFYDLQESEELIHLNSLWLKQHKQLEALSEEELLEKLKSIISSIPDRDSRIQQALEEEPRFKKLIRALCNASDQKLDKVTAGSPIDYKGNQILAWHFITDLGHHYMIDFNQQAIMFNGESDKVIVTISAGSKYGDSGT